MAQATAVPFDSKVLDGKRNYCVDCTPDYKKKMLSEGRCSHPKVWFSEDDDGWTKGHRYGAEKRTADRKPPAIRKPRSIYDGVNAVRDCGLVVEALAYLGSPPEVLPEPSLVHVMEQGVTKAKGRK